MGWSLHVGSFAFSAKQTQYKAGKELEKDGVRGDLFFYLATPKHDHFMSHELSFKAPVDVKEPCSIFAVVVDEEGRHLRDINLLIFCEHQDRFVHTKEKPFFYMDNNSTKTVKFRIETPSKCNMGKPFSVVHEVRSKEKVVVKSEGTSPVYVQTKRGGTTAVTKTADGLKSRTLKQECKGHNHHTRPRNKRHNRNPYDAAGFLSITPIFSSSSSSSSSSSPSSSSSSLHPASLRKRVRQAKGSGDDYFIAEHAQKLDSIVHSLEQLHEKVDDLTGNLHSMFMMLNEANHELLASHDAHQDTTSLRQAPTSSGASNCAGNGMSLPPPTKIISHGGVRGGLDALGPDALRHWDSQFRAAEEEQDRSQPSMDDMNDAMLIKHFQSANSS